MVLPLPCIMQNGAAVVGIFALQQEKSQNGFDPLVNREPFEWSACVGFFWVLQSHRSKDNWLL